MAVQSLRLTPANPRVGTKLGTIFYPRHVVGMAPEGPVSRILPPRLKTWNFFRISTADLSMMSVLAVWAGFASHWRHNFPLSIQQGGLFLF
jgi:hypothetical protein